MANRPQAKTVNTGVDKVKVFASILLATGGFVLYFMTEGNREVASWMRWVALVALLLVAVSVFLWSVWGKEFIAYCKESVREVKKVVWPTRKEAMQMTLYVFIFVVIISLFLWLVDITVSWVIVDKLLQWKQ